MVSQWLLIVMLLFGDSSFSELFSFISKIKHNRAQQNPKLAQWPMPLISAPRRLKRDNCGFEASLGYTVRSRVVWAAIHSQTLSPKNERKFDESVCLCICLFFKEFIPI